MTQDYKLDKKYYKDPRSPYFDDGYRPKLQPKFVKELNPGHLRPREPLRNPWRVSRNSNPFRELVEFQKYIWEGK